MPLATCARIFTVALGIAGIAWGCLTIPTFLRSIALEDAAARIIQGQAFRRDALLSLAPALEAVEAEPYCRAASLRNAAIIRLRIAETALSEADGRQIDKNLADLRSATVRSLQCSPTDAFLWLSLYWSEVTSTGFRPSHLEYLRMSYKLGPNEGWIMEKRNYLILALYSFLPADLREAGVAEFVKLLQPQFVVTAIRIFTGPGWPIRDLLLPRLASTPEAQRQTFSNILASRGFDVAVPGIVRRERPY